jgi:hypothetical protein
MSGSAELRYANHMFDFFFQLRPARLGLGFERFLRYKCIYIVI